MSLHKSPQPYTAASPGQRGGGKETENAYESDFEPETKPPEVIKKTERTWNVHENKGSHFQNLERTWNVIENKCS